MFTLNPDAPNPALLNLLLHGAVVTFDGGCYVKRVETDAGFHVEAGIGLTPHRMRFDLAEGELALRKVAEWFAAKRGEILKPRDVSQGIEPAYKTEYTRTVREEPPLRTQVFAYDEILVSVTTGDRRKVTLSNRDGDSYNIVGLPVDVWSDINNFIQGGGAIRDKLVAPDADTIYLCQQCGKRYSYGQAMDHFLAAGKVAPTLPLCFCSGVCQSLYKQRTGRTFPPVGAEIPLGEPLPCNLLTPLDETMLKEIESGKIQFKDQPPPDGPVYHGQVAPAYQQPDAAQRVVPDAEEGHEEETR